MPPLMKHKQDDGDLSIIAADGEILIACDQGHYWIVEAEMHTVDEDEAEIALDRRFGPTTMRALGRSA